MRVCSSTALSSGSGLVSMNNAMMYILMNYRSRQGLSHVGEVRQADYLVGKEMDELQKNDEVNA